MSPIQGTTRTESVCLENSLTTNSDISQVPEGYFVPFLPRRAFGVVNGAVRPPHGHGTFYVHRPPGLVDVPNSPAFGFLFSGYRRFDPEAPRTPHDFHASPASAIEDSALVEHGEALASADVEDVIP